MKTYVLQTPSLSNDWQYAVMSERGECQHIPQTHVRNPYHEIKLGDEVELVWVRTDRGCWYTIEPWESWWYTLSPEDVWR